MVRQKVRAQLFSKKITWQDKIKNSVLTFQKVPW